MAIAGWILARAGLAPVLHAVGRIGPVGFLAYCLYSALASLPLGAAWVASAPPLSLRRHLLTFTWARMVREAAADILPFSQVGGIVLGARVLIARGHSGPLVNAAMLVDMTTEMAGQIVFTLFAIAGFLFLRGGDGSHELLGPILVGTGVLTALMAAFFAAQRWAFDLGIALLGRVLPTLSAGVGETRDELARIYACRGRVIAALAFNLAGWIISASGAWLALTLMDVHLPLLNVLVIEGLIFALRSVAFMIPGAIGVQEAAYMLLGPLLGLPPTSAVALSLAKRARDLAIGIPALTGWQWGEASALRHAKSGAKPAAEPKLER